LNGNCYTLAIRQNTCQSNVNKNFENIYTNIAEQTEIPLSFGYTLTYINGTSTNISITLSNPIFIPNISFTIPADTFVIYDLPCECGTFRVYVGAKKISCAPTCCIN
jgi:hypothetical protein